MPKTLIVEDEKLSLEEAQEFVGGLVEFVAYGASPVHQVLVNEEGLLLDLPVNTFISSWCGQRLLGNALIFTGNARWTD